MGHEGEETRHDGDPARTAGRELRAWLSERGVGEKEVDPLLVAPLLAGFATTVLREGLDALPEGSPTRSGLRRLLDRVPDPDAAAVDWEDPGVRRRAVSLLPTVGDLPARLWGDRDLFLRLETVRDAGEPRQSLPVYPLWLVRAEPPLAEALVGAACIVDAPHRGREEGPEGHERTMALFSDGEAPSFARAVLAAYGHVHGVRDWASAFRAGTSAWREAPEELRARGEAVVRSLGEDESGDALPWRRPTDAGGA
jgi:hypothetical protein